MKLKEQKLALTCAVNAAQTAGEIMRTNLRAPKKVIVEEHHDIKLELDVRCQTVIEKTLRAAFPAIPVLGEESISGDPEADRRWVVDPIDGTVNYSYQIPHACVSIALQARVDPEGANNPRDPYETLAGVVYDPFTNELWTAIRGQPARLNGTIIRASKRRNLEDAVVSIGFAKTVETAREMMPILQQLIERCRKIRIMGSAALSMVYVAAGRFDAYVEKSVRLWDVAAGGLILESAKGEFWRRSHPDEYRYQLIANNGLLRSEIERIVPMPSQD